MNRSLSTRERQVLHLIADEKTDKEIAEELYISSHTAITHRRNLMQKLSARNAAGLIRRAFELGLLSVQQKLNAA